MFNPCLKCEYNIIEKDHNLYKINVPKYESLTNIPNQKLDDSVLHNQYLGKLARSPQNEKVFFLICLIFYEFNKNFRTSWMQVMELVTVLEN